MDKYYISAFFLMCTGLFLMGANCPGCFYTTDCKDYKKNKMQCESDRRCRFDKQKKACVMQPSGLLSGCFEIVDKEACKASKDCSYDKEARTCIEALEKGQCGNIQNQIACDADQNCVWSPGKRFCNEK